MPRHRLLTRRAHLLPSGLRALQDSGRASWGPRTTDHPPRAKPHMACARPQGGSSAPPHPPLGQPEISSLNSNQQDLGPEQPHQGPTGTRDSSLPATGPCPQPQEPRADSLSLSLVGAPEPQGQGLAHARRTSSGTCRDKEVHTQFGRWEDVCRHATSVTASCYPFSL